ncbi:MAG: UDP-N-acetylglucosamine--N-acetylmuramyl-(pentapeptide) pyrophosphoryl-undecaprenol N-acetylglucosamine transferase [Candidatus Sungiibacteriota bacterium]|uniref:UDP-N-acetylglucosamine--N-acetylmuramyl-(pentapeptide) pyrophosphoryl-undecaprenol N-acetylglucosamine transferase n=1 Tax=Candidatus Sungiibacteriota bacterium TaxID=2750080 RepID=A0A7T5URA4_9BACT|nr:MAG: UDP-N-acetylglucosamine--N-acetylmuramyl-(pentapeptide) pyrophosphoryl-undecaprenol N-acetylglucosamine transferase [Candidatus Sungbacteria bacterium]
MRILFTGGGTGGHFFPILAVIRELKIIAEEERILDLELYYMGPDDFGRDSLKEEGVVSINITTGKIRHYFSLANFTDIFKTILGTWQAVWNVFLLMPDIIFSKGGYGALPAVIAAAIFRIPLIIHESDAVPGKVNLFSQRFAKRIGIAFASSAAFFPKEKIALVGIPIRKRILGGSLEEAREHFSIFSQFPVVGFIGASQGAQKLNDATLGVLKELTDEFEIVHQTGPKNIADIKGETSVILESGHKERYHPLGFLNETEMRDFYLVSNLIVSRAGASSIFEIAAWGKPSILVPLENAAQDHQRKNAYEYAASGACVVIEQANLTPHVLLAEIKKVLGNPELMRKMSASAQRFSRIDSAELIAREILKLGIH